MGWFALEVNAHRLRTTTTLYIRAGNMREAQKRADQFCNLFGWKMLGDEPERCGLFERMDLNSTTPSPVDFVWHMHREREGEVFAATLDELSAIVQ